MSKIFSIAFSLLLISGVCLAQDLTGIKCIVNGDRAAKADASVDYKEGKVYFCCQNCVKKFKSEMAKEENAFAAKANHQLVLTGQYVQTGCPFSGSSFDKGKMAKVGGVEIGFCCDGCQSKVANAEGLAAKAALVFADAPFQKGFGPKTQAVSLEGIKCMMMPGKNVSEKFFAEYGGGKVHFCCKGCKGKFEKDPEKFATKANYHLVATGQVKQLACPISGQSLDDEQVSEVGDVKVKLCCENCTAMLAKAKDEKKKELVFGKKGFKKGFVEEK